MKLGSQLFHSLAEGPWPSYLTSLGPSFLIYKRHTVTVKASVREGETPKMAPGVQQVVNTVTGSDITGSLGWKETLLITPILTLHSFKAQDRWWSGGACGIMQQAAWLIQCLYTAHTHKTQSLILYGWKA